jgi:hypothetical protein
MSNVVMLIPITESDAFIADALREASIPALMRRCPIWVAICGYGRAAFALLPRRSGQSTMMVLPRSSERRSAPRLELLIAYRDRGSPALPPLEGNTLLRMMRLVAGDAVPDDYLPMLLADARIDVRPIAPRDWSTALKKKAGNFRVLIVGAGCPGC